MGIFNSFIGNNNTKQQPSMRAEEERLAAALDAASVPLMLVAPDFTVQRVNPALLAVLREAEADIRRVLPDFSAAQLAGGKLDQLHRDAVAQRRFLEGLQSVQSYRLSFGEREVKVRASPLFGLQRERSGWMLEWHDDSEARARQAEQARAQAAEEARVELMERRMRALDCAAACLMTIDDENKIRYVNESAVNLLQSMESDIRRELPHFSAANLVGRRLDYFHKDPGMIAQLRGTHRSDLQFGKRALSLIATPVFGTQNQRLGTVLEWQDRTAECTLEKVINEIIDKALRGELGERIDLGGVEGIVARVGSRVNDLLERVSSVMQEAGSSLNALATGDLGRPMQGEYQGSYALLQDRVNATIAKLLEAVGAIRETALAVKEGAGEIAAGNANLSQRTEEQAASLEQTSAAMEEITTTVQQNAANSQQANTLARSARETAENGGSVVGRAIDAMEAISESSNKISDIISVIDEIAFQTNLLSLNAAVEAARAGDQGRGFAVVADEVRSLAGRSATAAKEIKELIKDSVEKVKEGSTLVNRSGETLNDIVIAVKKVNDIVAEISTASEEQASGLDEINKAVSEMDEMTQQNAALVEEAAAASEFLGTKAESLENLLAFFRTPGQSSVLPAGQAMPEMSRRTDRRPRKPILPPPAKGARKPVKKVERALEESEQDWSEF